MGNNGFRIHLTNVAGAGAVQLAISLLPALEKNSRIRVCKLYLPDKGALAEYQIGGIARRAERYRRYLPNALSRIFECLLLSHAFNGDSPLLVLGDLPLRCKTRQIVFVQNSHLLQNGKSLWSLDGLRHAVYRFIFGFNSRYVYGVIVQTMRMKIAMAEGYPEIANRLFVVSQPVPTWMEDATAMPKSRMPDGAKLKLLYPAANYPHKNHRLIAKLSQLSDAWPIEYLKITLAKKENPSPDLSWIQCVGLLSAKQMIEAYRDADALLFLSLEESYGFPLLEAMYMGLPIVCPDLPYAHALCSDGAIYFNPYSARSLREALLDLHNRLAAGWLPDWSAQLSSIPRDWNEVANKIIDIAYAGSS